MHADSYGGSGPYSAFAGQTVGSCAENLTILRHLTQALEAQLEFGNPGPLLELQNGSSPNDTYTVFDTTVPGWALSPGNISNHRLPSRSNRMTQTSGTVPDSVEFHQLFALVCCRPRLPVAPWSSSFYSNHR